MQVGLYDLNSDTTLNLNYEANVDITYKILACTNTYQQQD